MGRHPQHGSAKELHWHVWGGKATDLQRRTALKQHAAAADTWLHRAGAVFRPVSHEWRDVLQWVRDGEAYSSRSREYEDNVARSDAFQRWEALSSLEKQQRKKALDVEEAGACLSWISLYS